MAYKKTDWRDTLRDAQGNVIQKGTPLNAQALGKIEDGIVQAEQKIDNEISQVAQQLAQTNQQKADKQELIFGLHGKRDKTTPIGLNDVGADLLAAIAGGEGASFNIESIPRNGSVSPEKTTFITNDPQNLFNPDLITQDVRLTVDGNEYADTAWFTSDFIRVTSGASVLIFANSTVSGRIIGYNKDKTFLKVLSNGYTTARGLELPIDFDGYIRVPISKTVGVEQVQIVESSVYNGSFTPYRFIMSPEINISLEALPSESVKERLIANNSIGGTKIKKESIDLNYHSVQTPIVFPSKPRNLFNKNDVKNDVYIARANGNETANTDYTASSFIKVEPGKLYTWAFRNQGAWYKADGTYLSGIPNEVGNTLVAPSGAYFMRMSTLKTNVALQMVVEGETLGEYEEHPLITSEKILALVKSGGNSPQNKLLTPEEIARAILFSKTPKKIKLLGDSRTHGSGGTGYAQNGDLIPGTDVRMNPNGYCWANSLRDLLARKYGVTVVNYAQAGKNSLHFYQQMNTLIEDDDDLIIMMLGTNDRHNMASVENTKTYQRAIIDLAHSKGIPVILMSAPPVTSTETTGDNDSIRNFGMFDLDKALQELAAEYGMKHISNYDNTLKFAEYRGISSDTLMSDGLHENDAGHDVIFRHVLRSLGITYVRPGVTK